MKEEISRRAYDDALLVWRWLTVGDRQRWVIVAVRPRIRGEQK